MVSPAIKKQQNLRPKDVSVCSIEGYDLHIPVVKIFLGIRSARFNNIDEAGSSGRYFIL
jgi:hypothetical protein